MNPQHQY